MSTTIHQDRIIRNTKKRQMEPRFQTILIKSILKSNDKVGKINNKTPRAVSKLFDLVVTYFLNKLFLTAKKKGVIKIKKKFLVFFMKMNSESFNQAFN